MSRTPLIVPVVVHLALSLAAQAAPPPDFKMHVHLYGHDKTPVAKSTVIVRQGNSYQFLSDFPNEVQVVEPRNNRVVLVDLRRGIQTEIGRAQLESSLNQLHRAIDRTVTRKQSSESRADRLSAAMTRDLIDPSFQTSFDSRAKQLSLKNASIEVTATGQSEPNADRLGQVRITLDLLTRLTALRDPSGLPPFPRLETFRELIDIHHLCPVDITLVYRLAGPPRRHRWAYDFVSSLTLDEQEAIVRLERLRADAPYVAYERYEKLIREDAPAPK